jgi:hypothetical protein
MERSIPDVRGRQLMAEAELGHLQLASERPHSIESLAASNGVGFLIRGVCWISFRDERADFITLEDG